MKQIYFDFYYCLQCDECLNCFCDYYIDAINKEWWNYNV